MVLVAPCTSIQRVSEIVQFHTKNMFGKDTDITFSIEGRVKHSRQGKTNPYVTLHEFLLNKKLCLVATLNVIMKHTSTGESMPELQMFFKLYRKRQ